jgi:hypothetical protein
MIMWMRGDINNGDTPNGGKFPPSYLKKGGT